MAENEGMEGKDFAKEEKIKEQFEKVIMQIINEMENDNATITIEGTDINIDVKKEKEAYQISLFGKQIATVREDEEFSYNIEELENIKKTLEDGKRPVAKYEDLGLPDIEYLKELEKEKEEKEKGEEDKNTDDEKEEKEEDEEKPDLEKDEEKDKDEGENKQLKKKSDWVKLDLNAEVVKGKTLRELLKCEDSEAYVAPGKGQYDYSIVGGDAEKGYKALDSLERTEGRAPNQKVMSIENNMSNNINENVPMAMFKLKENNREGFTISKLGDGIGQVRVEYYRKAYSDLYMSSTVPQQTADRGMDKPNKETRELMSQKYYSTTDLSKKIETYEEITNEVNHQNLPDDVNPASDGIQIEELDRETFKEKLIDQIVKDERAPGAQAPDYEKWLRNKATKMADKILDEDKDYSKAKEEVFGAKDQGGRTPDQGPRKRAE